MITMTKDVDENLSLMLHKDYQSISKSTSRSNKSPERDRIVIWLFKDEDDRTHRAKR